MPTTRYKQQKIVDSDHIPSAVFQPPFAPAVCAQPRPQLAPSSSPATSSVPQVSVFPSPALLLISLQPSSSKELVLIG